MTDPTTAPELTFTCIDNPDELSAIRDEWKTLAESCDADPHLHPDWFDVWWAHFAEGCELACVVLREDGHLVGIMPFVLRQVWFGPLRTKFARLSGTDPYTVHIRLPVREDLVSSAIQKSLSLLLGEKRCHFVSFTPVSELSDLAAALETTELAGDIGLKRISDRSHVVFQLPGSFEEHLAKLSKNHRKHFRHGRNTLVKRFAMESRITHPDREKFAEIIDLHDKQWQSVGRGGYFSDWPGSREFYFDLADRLDEDGILYLQEVVGSTGVLFMQFFLVSGKSCRTGLSARPMDPESSKLGAGTVGNLLMIESMIADGVTRIEDGIGEYDYKISLGGEYAGIERVIAYRDTPAGRLRMKALLAWADLLNLVYYRIWFVKLSPRFRKVTGMKPRPLWKSWIQTRL